MQTGIFYFTFFRNPATMAESRTSEILFTTPLPWNHHSKLSKQHSGTLIIQPPENRTKTTYSPGVLQANDWQLQL